MTRAALYLRVSTKEQSTENQESVLLDWAKRRGFDVVKIYSEEESAWKAGHQRALAQLVSDSRKGRFDVVLVWALDRLSREGALRILTIIDRLKQCGVRVISYQESWTEAPGELAELLYALTAWVARMESERRSERTKAGLQRAMKEGKPVGKRGPDKKKRKKRAPKMALFSGVE
ncbi:MAG: recombinase family protein [Desulfuromonadaceae bacterium]|nr:recombinase family protein [Desulfuromonadaceae bacterium]